MLERIVDERWVTAKAVVGLWPAAAVGDDVVVYADEARGTELATLHTLRQQLVRDSDHPEPARSPTSSRRSTPASKTTSARSRSRPASAKPSGRRRSRARTTTTTRSCSRRSATDSRRLSPSACTSMCAESCGVTRRTSSSSAAELIAERYAGIRPAPGYGCQPDHTEKSTIFELLDAPANAGVELTESFAILPGSSVTGFYFSHPQARYFGVGRIGTDQLEDYAARKGWSLDHARRWLATLLDDEPPATCGWRRSPARRRSPGTRPGAPGPIPASHRDRSSGSADRRQSHCRPPAGGRAPQRRLERPLGLRRVAQAVRHVLRRVGDDDRARSHP